MKISRVNFTVNISRKKKKSKPTRQYESRGRRVLAEFVKRCAGVQARVQGADRGDFETGRIAVDQLALDVFTQSDQLEVDK